MAYTDINKSTDYFNTNLWTGNGTSQSFTGIGFQPDWVWTKGRSHAEENCLTDVVRGTTKEIRTNRSDGEFTSANNITSFDSDGFSVGSGGIVNENARTYVGWSWKGANGTASNTDGSITSTVSASTASGVSIVGFTGTGANATVGHGLGKEVDFIFIKNRNDSALWSGYHRSLGGTKYISINSTGAAATASTQWNNTDPTSSVFSVGTSNNTNDSGDGMIAYCFASIKGFSKFGSYTGNGSTDGTFIYTGFKPAWVMVKRTNSTGSWRIWDNKREGYNGDNAFVYANLANAEEADGTVIDLLSNGFKFRNSSGDNNASGSTYIYMCFAENPFVTSTGIPGLAR